MEENFNTVIQSLSGMKLDYLLASVVLAHIPPEVFYLSHIYEALWSGFVYLL